MKTFKPKPYTIISNMNIMELGNYKYYRFGYSIRYGAYSYVFRINEKKKDNSNKYAYLTYLSFEDTSGAVQIGSCHDLNVAKKIILNHWIKNGKKIYEDV
jgi:hypothetical protein